MGQRYGYKIHLVAEIIWFEHEVYFMADENRG